jgi:hypothetical protein
MSISTDLQTLVYQRLIANAGVSAIVGSRVFDGKIRQGVTFPYVTFGPSDQIEDDADCITGLIETIQIDCWSRAGGGFLEVKELADAVRRALHRYSGDMGSHALVEMRVTGTRLFRDPDGITNHAVISVQAMIEEV